MPVTDFLQLQRAEVVAEGTGAPRRVLRLELGAGLTCSTVATTSTVTATLQADGGAGSSTAQVPVLAASVLVQRSEGVLVAASTVPRQLETTTGTTTLQAVLAAPQATPCAPACGT